MADLCLMELDPTNPNDWYICTAVIDERRTCRRTRLTVDIRRTYEEVESDIVAAQCHLFAAFHPDDGRDRLTDALQDFRDRNEAVFGTVAREWQQHNPRYFAVYIAVLTNLSVRLLQKVRRMQQHHLQGATRYEKCMTCVAPLVCCLCCPLHVPLLCSCLTLLCSDSWHIHLLQSWNAW